MQPELALSELSILRLVSPALVAKAVAHYDHREVSQTIAPCKMDDGDLDGR